MSIAATVSDDLRVQMNHLAEIQPLNQMIHLKDFEQTLERRSADFNN